MSSILFVTLARGGSKGVPGKHTRMLDGKTVLEWTLHAVMNCWHFYGNYVLSSDDPEILDVGRRNYVNCIERPPELARDDTPTLPALLHAVEKAEEIYRKKFEYVVEVRATSPFKTSKDIDSAVDMLLKSDAESVIGVTLLDDHHPMRAKWIDVDGYIREFIREPDSGRRQDCLPKAYIRNGTIYAFRTPITKLFGHEKSLAYVMPPERSINIDTEMDWKLCIIIANGI